MESYLFGILVVLLVFTGVTGGLGILIFIGVPRRHPTDASHLNLDPPANAQTSVERLIEMDFHRLGETYTHMPLAMSPGATWIYVNEAGTTQAEILEINPGAILATIFDDGAMIETGFPQGEDITTPNFISQTVTSGIEDAYQLHLQTVDDFQKEHGIPQKIHDMNDYFHWDKLYRTRYAQRRLRRVFIIDFIQVLALIYGIIVSIVVLILWARNAPVPQWITDWDRGLFVLLSPAFLISLSSILIGVLGSRRNRKRAQAANL